MTHSLSLIAGLILSALISVPVAHADIQLGFSCTDEQTQVSFALIPGIDIRGMAMGANVVNLDRVPVKMSIGKRSYAGELDVKVRPGKSTGPLWLRVRLFGAEFRRIVDSEDFAQDFRDMVEVEFEVAGTASRLRGAGLDKGNGPTLWRELDCGPIAYPTWE